MLMSAHEQNLGYFSSLVGGPPLLPSLQLLWGQYYSLIY